MIRMIPRLSRAIGLSVLGLLLFAGGDARPVGAATSTIHYIESFEDDFIAGRSIPDMVDPALSGPFSPINSKVGNSCMLTIRDRGWDNPGGEGGGFPPNNGDAALDFSFGCGNYVTFKFSAPGGIVTAGSSITFRASHYCADGGHLSKYVSSDGVTFTQVGDNYCNCQTFTFPLAAGGADTYFRLQVGTQAGVYEGVWVNDFDASVVYQSTINGWPLRIPQVQFGTCYPNESLQTYLNNIGEQINASTDQLDLHIWESDYSGNATFTMVIEIAGNASGNEIGIYNKDNPAPRFPVFPGPATAGWFAVASFYASGQLIVNLFDGTATLVSTTSYAGVDRNAFGFYLQGPGGLFFSQDDMNGGGPQALVYAGTGRNIGTWWLCWEDRSYFDFPCDRNYGNAVLQLESIVPIPVQLTTWGRLKALF